MPDDFDPWAEHAPMIPIDRPSTITSQSPHRLHVASPALRATTDDKYATFKREDLISVTDGYVTFKTSDELPDAVVIRRQDFFASPALATYASMIAMATKLANYNDAIAQDLLRIADYFERQAQLAADEGPQVPHTRDTRRTTPHVRSSSHP